MFGFFSVFRWLDSSKSLMAQVRLLLFASNTCSAGEGRLLTRLDQRL